MEFWGFDIFVSSLLKLGIFAGSHSDFSSIACYGTIPVEDRAPTDWVVGRIFQLFNFPANRNQIRGLKKWETFAFAAILARTRIDEVTQK